MRRPKKLKHKIIAICAACVILVGCLSNLLLYSFLSGIISEKADNIEQMSLRTVQNQMISRFDEMAVLASTCANDYLVARAMHNKSMDALTAKQQAIRASDQLNAYLRASNIQNYVNRLVAFNGYGVRAQASARTDNAPNDPQRIEELPLFGQLPLLEQRPGLRELVAMSRSIGGSQDCIALLSPIYDYASSTYHGWIYLEINLQWVQDIVSLHQDTRYILTVDGQGYIENRSYVQDSDFVLLRQNQSSLVNDDGSTYKIYKAGIQLPRSSMVWIDKFSVYAVADVTLLMSGGYPIIYTLVVVAATSLIIGVVLAIVLSGLVTRPLHTLTTRLRRIAENDFAYDPSIEKGNDEIAEMGRVVNEMTVSISHLLKETEEMYIQRKNTEIALLQTQVNPHFLYNTLDSIRWMATIHKNPGIINMAKSLSNLLRNLAKGVDDRIPLREELALLEDYVAIQSIRYVETFRFDNRVEEHFLDYKIIKFTLQPIVENAIFHGIEPTGRFGVISVTAEEEGDYLLIHVLDDGKGMSREEMEKMMLPDAEKQAAALSGVGVANVHNRLRLQYGNTCGLQVESEEGVYTRVTLRIPKER